MKAFTLVVWRAWVHKCKFLNFFDLCVRKIDFLQQLTVVTGMRFQHLEVPRKLKCTCPCGTSLRQLPGTHSSWQLLWMSASLQDKSG